jgi:hypothetical protein
MNKLIDNIFGEDILCPGKDGGVLDQNNAQKKI